ncbi:MAG: hypothetical protein KC457_20405 [Myxococcales bacterium]|nr:hypothetical protein [Myxococcales bacterium]
MAPTVHIHRQGKLLATEGAVVYAVIDPAALRDDGDVPRTAAVIASVLEEHKMVALLMIIEHGTTKPTPDERREMQEALARFGDRLVVGYAFCGLGFWANTLHMVLVGISRLAGSSVIIQGSVAETADRLALELIGLNPERMTRNGEALRKMLTDELSAELSSP